MTTLPLHYRKQFPNQQLALFLGTRRQTAYTSYQFFLEFIILHHQIKR
jgi:hypothetical protein